MKLSIYEIRESISIKKSNKLASFSRVHNNLSSTPKEEGEQLEETEDEEELEEDNESPPTG